MSTSRLGAGRHRSDPRSATRAVRAGPIGRLQRENVRRFGRVVALVAVAVLLCSVLSVSGLLPEWVRVVIDNYGQLTAGTAATAGLLVSWWRHRGPDERWRLLLGLGMLGWSAGQSVWTYYNVFTSEDMPSPSLADVGFFCLPLLALPAFWVFPTRRSAGISARSRVLGGADSRPYSRIVFILDSMVTVGSLSLLAWVTSLGVLVQAAPPDQSTPQLLLAAAYPVTDLILVVFIVLLFRFWTPRNLWALALLGLGAVALSASDSAYLYVVSTGGPEMPPLYNIGFVLGPALFGLAAFAPEPAPERRLADGPEPTDRGLVLLPYLPLTVTGVLMCVRLLRGHEIDPIEQVAALALILLVILRQFITLLDNNRLLEQVREGQAQLHYQAFNDSLTGVANRALFRHRLDSALVPGPDGDGIARPQIALMFCDLDDFKVVNDGLGHAAGDEVLREVARRISACVRPDDIVARLGGDEFAVLLAPEADMTWIGNGILAALGRSFEVPGVGGATILVEVGVSIGGAVLDAEDDRITPDALLARVDAAMYAAKRQGKNRMVIFRGGKQDDEVSALISELRLLLTSGGGDARPNGTAARNGRTPRPSSAGSIDVVYQPVVRVSTREVLALEALVRWRHPRLGTLPAEVVLATATDAGLLDALENLVLDTACRDIARLRTARGFSRVAVHVNVSAMRTADRRLVEIVSGALKRHRLPGQALVVEITETDRVPDLTAAAAALELVRELGVRCALDDFGSGFSGLSYLLALPIDIVKLDRSLTTAAAMSRAAAVRQAATTLTLGMGLTLIAEGVESPGQAATLVRMGCDLGQGFLFAHPQYLSDLELTLRIGEYRQPPQTQRLTDRLVSES